MSEHLLKQLGTAALATGIAVCTSFAATTDRPVKESIAFPKDDSVLDARRDCGAKGDGAADDTEALQKAIEASCRGNGRQSKVLFIPNGTYRVTRSLVVESSVGPWVYGESRDGVVIRLADGITDTNCTAVLRTHPNEKGKTSADWFMRNFRNLTIDVGNNPGVDGILTLVTQAWHPRHHLVGDSNREMTC